MKLEVVLTFAIILAAILVGTELASEYSACSDRGGDMVRTPLGGAACVKGQP
jgi:hypothetical protein